MIDEMFIHLDDPVRPLTIQLEARVEGRLDEERMRTAVQVAVRQHHLARARLKPWSADAKTYEWLVDDESQIDPFRVIESSDPARLDDVRGDFYSRAISLVESPPFRVLLVHDPGGDLVMLAVNHTACDGVGALRLMQSVGRAYAGLADPTVDIDPAEAHRLAIPTEGRGLQDRLHSGRMTVRQVTQMRGRPAKVVAKDPSPDPGYGVHTMRLPVAPLVASPLRRRLGATVNDLLLAAVHRSIHEWNRQEGGSAGVIAIGMPVNARPEAWRYETMGNLITSEVITTTKGQRQSPEACLAAVAGWTEAVKRRGPGPALASQARGWQGRVSHRRSLGKVIKVVAHLLSGTAALSNLGVVAPDWVDSADFRVREVWVSPPTVGVGLAIGTVSMGDTLFVSMRYSPELFSKEAAAEFAAVLRTEVDLLCGEGDHPAP